MNVCRRGYRRGFQESKLNKGECRLSQAGYFSSLISTFLKALCSVRTANLNFFTPLCEEMLFLGETLQRVLLFYSVLEWPPANMKISFNSLMGRTLNPTLLLVSCYKPSILVVSNRHCALGALV